VDVYFTLVFPPPRPEPLLFRQCPGSAECCLPPSHRVRYLSLFPLRFFFSFSLLSFGVRLCPFSFLPLKLNYARGLVVPPTGTLHLTLFNSLPPFFFLKLSYPAIFNPPFSTPFVPLHAPPFFPTGILAIVPLFPFRKPFPLDAPLPQISSPPGVPFFCLPSGRQ